MSEWPNQRAGEPLGVSCPPAPCGGGQTSNNKHFKITFKPSFVTIVFICVTYGNMNGDLQEKGDSNLEGSWEI